MIIEKGVKCIPQILSEGREKYRRKRESQSEKYKRIISPKNSTSVSFLPDIAITRPNHTITGNFNQFM
jgi:hypothetical protein